MNTYGENFRVSIFGESHGEAIGAVIDGVRGGLRLDMDFILKEMARRAPGRDEFSTPRLETDAPEILSGVKDGVTSGTPICAVIENANTRSRDYTPQLLRPGHADFTGFMKYGAAHDYRGGGHFSGRITAPLVFSGAIAKLILKERGITVGAHIKSIGAAEDRLFDKVNLTEKQLCSAANKLFPVLDDESGERMKREILAAKTEADSVGGVIECGAAGLDAGLGDPFFGSVESRISGMMFSIPAVKGIEFGAGFDFAKMRGSEANDEFYMSGDAVKTKTNNNAGINGGITNGMPIVFSVAVKPTPSIGREQKTVDVEKKENAVINIKGRHDPCIVQRAVPVVEAGLAIVLADMIR